MKKEEKGRYSICGYKSIKTIQINNSENKKKNRLKSSTAFSKIDKLISQYKFKKNKNLPPMSGAFFGYFAYENINNIESVSKFKKKNTLRTPELILFIPEILIIYDNINKSLFILKHFITENKNILKYEQNVNELNEVENNLKTKIQLKKYNLNKSKKLKIKSNISKAKFIKNVKKAKKYIKNGDIFQVVPSQRFETVFNSKGSHLYEVLRMINPSPFMYYFNLLILR